MCAWHEERGEPAEERRLSSDGKLQAEPLAWCKRCCCLQTLCSAGCQLLVLFTAFCKHFNCVLCESKFFTAGHYPAAWPCLAGIVMLHGIHCVLSFAACTAPRPPPTLSCPARLTCCCAAAFHHHPPGQLGLCQEDPAQPRPARHLQRLPAHAAARHAGLRMVLLRL
jgi:hypothetical protein